ncbi:MAG TPA: flavin reductase [Candidatus Limnocylindria bacterium]|nr:flavin reductase [Candidatus Limnocylindria bacterium]
MPVDRERYRSLAGSFPTGVAIIAARGADRAPIPVESSVAYAECLTDRTIEAGDHWIVTGRVEGGEVLGGTPLLYGRRTYAAWPEERPAPRVG